MTPLHGPIIIANSMEKTLHAKTRIEMKTTKDVTMDNGGDTKGMPCEVTTFNESQHYELLISSTGQLYGHPMKMYYKHNEKHAGLLHKEVYATYT